MTAGRNFQGLCAVGSILHNDAHCWLYSSTGVHGFVRQRHGGPTEYPHFSCSKCYRQIGHLPQPTCTMLLTTLRSAADLSLWLEAASPAMSLVRCSSVFTEPVLWAFCRQLLMKCCTPATTSVTSAVTGKTGVVKRFAGLAAHLSPTAATVSLCVTAAAQSSIQGFCS